MSRETRETREAPKAEGMVWPRTGAPIDDGDRLLAVRRALLLAWRALKDDADIWGCPRPEERPGFQRAAQTVEAVTLALGNWHDPETGAFRYSAFGFPPEADVDPFYSREEER